MRNLPVPSRWRSGITATGEGGSVPGTIPAVAWHPVMIISGALGLVLMIASGFGGYFFDELYFLAAGGRNLSWGYMDQPPLVPVVTHAMDTLFPGSVVALRLPVALVSAGGVVIHRYANEPIR